MSIYKNGQEKAYIEFNAIGANQNNWFDPSRIISSSYTDIKTATKEVFSMMGYVLSFSDLSRIKAKAKILKTVPHCGLSRIDPWTHTPENILYLSYICP